jgi:hypothetical protein
MAQKDRLVCRHGENSLGDVLWCRRGLRLRLAIAKELSDSIQHLIEITPLLRSVQGSVDPCPLAAIFTGASVGRAEIVGVEQALTCSARSRLQTLDEREALVGRPAGRHELRLVGGLVLLIWCGLR